MVRRAEVNGFLKISQQEELALDFTGSDMVVFFTPALASKHTDRTDGTENLACLSVSARRWFLLF